MNEPSALLELQGIDVEVLRANKRLDSLPEKTAILEVRAKEREVSGMGQKAAMLVRKLEAELKARQDEITTLNEKLGVEQAKIMETSDHRAVQSITREMDGFRRRIDKLEMESLQYMERVEKARGQLGKIEEAKTSLSAKEAALIERFRAVGGELQKEIATLEAKRAKLAEAVTPEVLGRYESARESKGGIGVGRLEGGSCSACRMSLPAERLQELTTGPDIGMCPQCRRPIVVRGGDEQ